MTAPGTRQPFAAVCNPAAIGGAADAKQALCFRRLMTQLGGFLVSRRVQIATLAARHGIPSAHATREDVEVGGLMSYGTDIPDMWRQVGSYTGQILKGAKPADLPVMQSTKFEFVINLQTARALGIEVPNSIQLLADEVIE